MKKILNYLLFILVLLMPNLVNAASISITGPSTAVVGNTISVNVKLSAGESWQMILDYDSSMLQLISGGGEAGGVNMVNTSIGNASRSYSFKFKTLKTGKTNISISSYDVVDDNGADVSCSISNKSVSIITQAELEASYSKNNNLKSLIIDGFDIIPQFDKDILEYNATVPENTTEVNIKASVADNTATVTGEGQMPVELGLNKFEIVVKAQNGDEKKYVLNIEVKDSNPIEVKIENETFTLVKIAKSLTKPNSYLETNITIEDYQIPAFKSDVTGLTLVGLKDSDGEVSLYSYKDGNYKKYIELSLGSISIYIKDGLENIKGYTKNICSIKDNDIECLYKKKTDRYRIIYGVNVESNEEGYYLYDTKDKALIKYDLDSASEINQKIDLLTYISVGLAATTFISLVLVISLASKKGKKKNKKKEDLVNTVIEEVEIENNEIVEDSNIEEENIIEDNNEIKEIDDDYDDSFLSEREKKKLKRKHK